MNYHIFEYDFQWGHSTVFIAKDGMSTIDLSVANEQSDYGMLRGLMVHPSARHKGCANMLLDFAENEAKQRGLKFTFVEINKQWMKEWFERRGYKVAKEKEFSVWMYKEL